MTLLCLQSFCAGLATAYLSVAVGAGVYLMVRGRK